MSFPGQEPGTLARITIGPDYIGAVTMENSGIVFYDFSKHTKPEQVTWVYRTKTDPDTAATTPFNVGVIDAQEGMPGQWYVIFISFSFTYPLYY